MVVEIIGKPDKPRYTTAFLVLVDSSGRLNLITDPNMLDINMEYEATEVEVRKLCYQVQKDLEATLFAQRTAQMRKESDNE